MTLKQLGIYKGPIIILNTMNFYDSLIEFLEHMIAGNFLRYEHKGMWEIASTVEDVMILLSKREDWHPDPRKFARI
jgi:predicted Rossmann-fold nucleotide-binding protein